jgi:hypothetical protein
LKDFTACLQLFSPQITLQNRPKQDPKILFKNIICLHLNFSKLRFACLTEKFGKSAYLAVTLQKKF